MRFLWMSMEAGRAQENMTLLMVLQKAPRCKAKTGRGLIVFLWSTILFTPNMRK